MGGCDHGAWSVEGEGHGDDVGASVGEGVDVVEALRLRYRNSWD
jgi:hypothetical protein